MPIETTPPTTLPSDPPAERRAQLDAIAAKQGVQRSATYEAMLGRGHHLWADDADLDRFLTTVANAKRDGE